MAAEVTCIVDTDSGAGYDYTSLNAALVGEAGGSPVVVTSPDLVTNDERLIIECRATSGSQDTAQVTVTGFTTGSDDYVVIQSSGANRHAGVLDTNLYDLWVNGGAGVSFTVSNNYTRIIGIQGGIHTYSQTFLSVPATVTNVLIDSCILRQGSGGSSTGIMLKGSDAKAVNNIIYDFVTSGIIEDYTNATYGYNNTIVNCGIGILGHSSNSMRAVNNIVQDCTTDFSSNFHSSSNYNLSDSTGSPGANSVDNSNLTFADAATDDYHLASGDTDAIGAGIGPSSDSNVPTTDIDGDTRSGTTCDIGADEYAAAGGLSIPVAMNQLRTQGIS